MDEFDVTIAEAELFCSRVTGLCAVVLELLPHGLCFHNDRVISKLYCHMSNEHPNVGVRRAGLRSALGMVGSGEPFTDEESVLIVGRCLRVGVETIEFEGILRLRVVDFLHYSGVEENRAYSDSEYVFMMRELLQEASI